MNQQQQKKYEEYVKQVTPTHSLIKQVLKAFFSGGVICTLGQWITNILMEKIKKKKYFNKLKIKLKLKIDTFKVSIFKFCT